MRQVSLKPIIKGPLNLFLFFAVTQIHCVHNTHISLSESPLWDKEDTKNYHVHEDCVVHYAMATK